MGSAVIIAVFDAKNALTLKGASHSAHYERNRWSFWTAPQQLSDEEIRDSFNVVDGTGADYSDRISFSHIDCRLYICLPNNSLALFSPPFAK